MKSYDYLDILSQGVTKWNLWREENPSIKPEFLRVDLSGKDLSGINMQNVILYASNLGNTNLTAANFKQSNLGYTDFSGADLTKVDFSWAYTVGVNFSNVLLNRTTFNGVDLSRLKNLANVIHIGPSSIGIDSIEMTAREILSTKNKNESRVDADPILGSFSLWTDHSAAGSPGIRPYQTNIKTTESFLLGAGVPNQIINVFKLMIDTPMDFYSCFISYSHADEEFAQRLYSDLQREGIRCWFAPHHIRSGRKLHEQIYSAIHEYDRLLLILSKESIESEWVKSEISFARKREVDEKRQILFPIRLIDFGLIRDWKFFDADIGKDSAREVREFFIPDFSNWKVPAEYNREFQRLVQDLRPEDNSTGQ